MDENMFNLGLDVATISTELPDPVITLSGADSYTVQDTADYPLLALSLYGKSVQDGTPTPDAPIDIVSVGDDGDVEIMVDNDNGIALSAIVTSGLPLCSVGDYRDELIYNADGTGKIIKRTGITTFDGSDNEEWELGSNYIRIGSPILSGVIAKTDATNPIANCICTNLPIVSANETFNGTQGLAISSSGRVFICIASLAGNSDITAWTSYFAENPLTVVYVLNTPQEIELSAAEMAALKALQSYENTTNIYNNEQAEMLVKMLRREFDMKYIEWLKESQTWVCPKAGKWKVICVGGGASGGMYEEATGSGATEKTLTPTTAGGTTSFGSIIAADGAPSTSDYTAHGSLTARIAVSGYGGYTGTSYGGVPMIGGNSSSVEFGAGGGSGNAAVMAFANPTAAVGYGAGGGAGHRDKGNFDVSPIPGRAGAIESTIVDLDEGQTIMCTVGKGGQTTDATGMGSGADGVIVVQYLGY